MAWCAAHADGTCTSAWRSYRVSARAMHPPTSRRRTSTPPGTWSVIGDPRGQRSGGEAYAATIADAALPPYPLAPDRPTTGCKSAGDETLDARPHCSEPASLAKHQPRTTSSWRVMEHDEPTSSVALSHGRSHSQLDQPYSELRPTRISSESGVSRGCKSLLLPPLPASPLGMYSRALGTRMKLALRACAVGSGLRGTAASAIAYDAGWWAASEMTWDGGMALVGNPRDPTSVSVGWVPTVHMEVRVEERAAWRVAERTRSSGRGPARLGWR
jgi:hypothetical protein